jgi:hypothetical protein
VAESELAWEIAGSGQGARNRIGLLKLILFSTQLGRGPHSRLKQKPRSYLQAEFCAKVFKGPGIAVHTQDNRASFAKAGPAKFARCKNSKLSLKNSMLPGSALWGPVIRS